MRKEKKWEKRRKSMQRIYQQGLHFRNSIHHFPRFSQTRRLHQPVYFQTPMVPWKQLAPSTPLVRGRAAHPRRPSPRSRSPERRNPRRPLRSCSIRKFRDSCKNPGWFREMTVVCWEENGLELASHSYWAASWIRERQKEASKTTGIWKKNINHLQQ